MTGNSTRRDFIRPAVAAGAACLSGEAAHASTPARPWKRVTVGYVEYDRRFQGELIASAPQ
jgi:hypothetical protein